MTHGTPPDPKSLLSLSMHPDCLVADIACYDLRGGAALDISWHPEHDPEGCYYLTIFRDEWENKIVERSARTVGEMCALIVEMEQAWNMLLGETKEPTP